MIVMKYWIAVPYGGDHISNIPNDCLPSEGSTIKIVHQTLTLIIIN